MEKLVYLLGETEPGIIPRAQQRLRDALLEAGPALARTGAARVRATVADLEDPELDRVAQFNRHGLLDASLSLWLDSLDERGAVDEIVAPLASRCAAYLVTESVPRDTDPANPTPGERLPGVALVTTFPKPDHVDDETFFARWHDSHTPLSLEIHPLLRYVRNAVARSLTRGAPPVRAIVDESVASVAIMADPEQFYGNASDQERAYRDLVSFTHLEELSAVLMSAYAICK